MVISLLLSIAAHQPDFQSIASKMSGQYVGAEVRTSDGKNHLFFVDSGSNQSYVSRDILAENDKKKDVSVIRLDMGPYQITANAEPVDPRRFPISIGGTKTEGILGLNLLKQIQLDIDYDAQTIKGRYGGALSWAGPGYMPLLMTTDSDRLYTIAGQIGGKTVRLSVDTGSTGLVVDAKRIDLQRYPKLPAAKIRTFNGIIDSDRYLVESMKIGDHEVPWMITGVQPWRDADDGIIGAAMLGGSRVVLDFPGACIYVAKPDNVSEAACRILGIPVRVDSDTLKFREGLGGILGSSSGAKIVSIRGVSSESILSALRKQSPDASKTLVELFTKMRALGLVMTERDGERQIVPVQVAD